MTTSDLPLTCVIGAGSSGITAARSLQKRGIPFEVYEAGARVGGNWVFQNTNGMSSAYRDLHANTSRDRTQYAALPMPRSFPHFPHHTQMAAYFEDFVEHFGLRDHICFNTSVERAERLENGDWSITTGSGETKRFDALLVANGHHWKPAWAQPPFPGQFSGHMLHSHEYLDNDGFRGKTVLVVGLGNSAMDIAVESTQAAHRTLVSTRRGQHILPKWLFGRPLDQVGAWPWTTRLPWRMRQTFMSALIRLAVGRPQDYGLPKPSQGVARSEVSVSSRFPDRVLHGRIEMKPGIEALNGENVTFADGSSERVDVIVQCTGYRIAFPFFDPEFLDIQDNQIHLYRNLALPGVDNLFFIGLLQPLGAHMPLAEAQGEWVGEYLCGRYEFPSSDAIEKDIRRLAAAHEARYIQSIRHTIQVDRDDYPAFIRREMLRGARRARRSGNVLPLPARAQRAPVLAAKVSVGDPC